LAGALPQTPLRELTGLPQIPQLDLRGPTYKGEGKGKGGRGGVGWGGKGRKRKGRGGRGKRLRPSPMIY